MTTEIPFGIDDWGLLPGNLSRIKLRNMFLGENPFQSDGVSRYMRPSLDEYLEIGEGPIYLTFKEDNVFDSDLFIVSKETLYRLNTNDDTTEVVGSLPGAGLVEVAATADIMLFLRNGLLYLYDGTSLSSVATPDTVRVRSISQINSYFLLSVEGSARFYWMQPGETTIDPLDFASAERLPDEIASIRVISDEIWLIGTKSTEVWYNTGDADAPFVRVTGRAYSYGTPTSFSAVATSVAGLPCLFWVTSTNEVAQAQGGVTIISTASIKSILSDNPVRSCWAFSGSQFDFYVVNTDTRTVVYNIQKQSWSSWDSYGYDYWVAQTGTQANGITYTGSIVSNKLLKLGKRGKDGDDPIVCQLSGFIGTTENSKVRCNKVSVILNTGWVEDYSVSPFLELRWSDDGGFTFSTSVLASLGEKGQYDQNVEFRSLGSFRKPGRLFELTFSQLENCRIDLAWMD
jgi:hypothetical protein